MHRIEASVRQATVPGEHPLLYSAQIRTTEKELIFHTNYHPYSVFMAALSSMAGGAVMLFAQTHAFFQVAIFLCVSTAWSFSFATFLFLPLLYCGLSLWNRGSSEVGKFDCYRCGQHTLQLKALRQQR